MRVTIRHEDKRAGLLCTQHKVAVVTSVQFSEEELAIINSRKLKKYVVLKREPDAVVANRFKNDPEYLYSIAQGFHLTIGNLVKGPDEYSLDSPVEAKVYEERLTQALKTLKGFINGNEVMGEGTSFEL